MKKPTGYIAICQCGNTVGAMDYNRTDKQYAGKMFSEWIKSGLKLEPKFESSWEATIKKCECND